MLEARILPPGGEPSFVAAWLAAVDESITQRRPIDWEATASTLLQCIAADGDPDELERVAMSTRRTPRLRHAGHLMVLAWESVVLADVAMLRARRTPSTVAGVLMGAVQNPLFDLRRVRALLYARAKPEDFQMIADAQMSLPDDDDHEALSGLLADLQTDLARRVIYGCAAA